MKRLIRSSLDTGLRYWYYTSHGAGPGSVPRDIDILYTLSMPYGDYFLSRQMLNTEELREFDIKEKIPTDEEIDEYGDREEINKILDEEGNKFNLNLY